MAIARVRDKKAVALLFDERVSEFTDRAGGYTRIYKLGQRVGDAAEMGLIELIDGNDEGYEKPKKKAAKKKATKKAAKKSVKEKSEETAPIEDTVNEEALKDESADEVETPVDEKPMEEISTEEK